MGTAYSTINRAQIIHLIGKLSDTLRLREVHARHSGDSHWHMQRLEDLPICSKKRGTSSPSANRSGSVDPPDFGAEHMMLCEASSHGSSWVSGRGDLLMKRCCFSIVLSWLSGSIECLTPENTCVVHRFSTARRVICVATTAHTMDRRESVGIVLNSVPSLIGFMAPTF